MESSSIAEFPAFVPYHCQEIVQEPETASMETGFSDPEMSESAALLATLSLLACRLEPEMAPVSKILCSQLKWSDQRAALIGADILAASGLFAPSSTSQPLFPVLENSTASVAINRAIFDDREVQAALWKAADPDFALLHACTATQPTAAAGTPDPSDSLWGPQMVSAVLARLGIYYTLHDTYLTLNTQKIMANLVWGYRWVPEAAEHIYQILFSRETFSTISETLEKEGSFESDYEEEEKDDFLIDFYSFDHIDPQSIDADMKQSLKLLAVSVTIFLGAGLVLGHTLT
ncbi:hypothetical protein B9G98_03127 [Wickerhamiella sorbophila]|uniref:Uncharacterized protein n=1 Tax=Wickerhamiella sorbophila TaxID=45607 RepID=A0A2T0FKK9_9ASCO|nr:hypothetical protein B9G98_03127 [Wickerhamiella sorbophila]PRT55507.1 hypothetical protein B9G98_03127 [Wickerhamiella sorbophila]